MISEGSIVYIILDHEGGRVERGYVTYSGTPL